MDERLSVQVIAEAIETHLGFRPVSVNRLSGRSIWEVQVPTGTVIFKGGRGRLPMLEAWAYERAREAGVPVPQVLAVERKAPLFPQGYVIMTKAQGTPLSGLKVRRRRRSSLLSTTGDLVRRIHGVVTDGFGWPDGSHFRATGRVRGSKPSWSLAVHRWVGSILSSLEEQRVLEAETGRAVRAAFERHDDALQSWRESRLLHGDFLLRHVLADSRGRTVTGIVDFEGFLLGDPVYDLAVFAFLGDEDLGDLLAGYGPDEAMRESLGVKMPLYQLLRAVSEVSWGHSAGANAHGMRRRMKHVQAALSRLEAA